MGKEIEVFSRGISLKKLYFPAPPLGCICKCMLERRESPKEACGFLYQ